MSTLRMTSDLRRQLILSAAKRCFARNGFAGTTTKSVAAAAAISEGLLFKHFPSKAALYAEILAEECEADPDFANLLGQEPSTRTLICVVSDAATARTPELAIHLRMARRQGWTEDELIEVLLHLSGYVGVPLIREAMLTAKDVFGEMRKER